MGFTLINRSITPPGGYRYFVESTRYSVTAPSLELLVKWVRKHLVENELPVPPDPVLELAIQAQMCRMSPPGVCRDAEGVAKMTGRSLTLDQVIKGTNTLADWFLNYSAQKVAQGEADERSRVCASCFANVKPDGCTNCASAWMRAAVDKIVGGNPTAHDGELKACYFCGCQLRALVWMPMELLQKHTTTEENTELPDHCWKKKL